jgi:hypothetical protein
MAVFDFRYGHLMLRKLRVTYLNFYQVISRIAYAKQSLNIEQELSVLHLTVSAASERDCIIYFHIGKAMFVVHLSS